MPRSPIRRPSAKIDISSVFRDVDQLPERLTSDSLFGVSAPLEIEVGSGKGLFLAGTSKNTPQHHFVGIEINRKFAEHAAGRIVTSREGDTPNNVVMIAGNAEVLFAERVPPASVEAIHVYFPDPWWKKKHRKRRVVNETSIRRYSAALRPGGRFHFWTDVLDYFESTIELIAETTPEFGVPIPEEENAAEHDLDYRTHFERRSRRNRIPVYRVRFEKR